MESIVTLNDVVKEIITVSLHRMKSRYSLNISELDDETIKIIVDSNLMKKVSDIFFINEKELETILSSSKAKKLYKEIHTKCYNVKLCNFLYASNIPKLTYKTCKNLSENFSNIYDLLRALNDKNRENEIIKLCGSQDVYVSLINNKKNIGDLLPYIFFKDESIYIDDLSNKTKTPISVCITGTLTVPRDTMISYLKCFGVEVTNTVLKRNDYLIVGSNPGKAKLNKAASYGIKEISQKEIEDMIKNFKN